ncbi:MAG TPA: PilZ domain-containing protein [Terriglobales bacterium]|nr:PilZ domain-containing protein [Terriglobales bacterium]
MIGERNWARRRYPRVAVDTALRAHIYCSETSEITIRGRCRQFGEGGLGATLADQLLPGEVVTLEITPALKVYGVARYMRGYFHGFEFIMLRDRQREALRAFYNSHAPRRPQA